MLPISGSFVYLFATAYLLGNGFLILLKRVGIKETNRSRGILNFLLGIGILTVYAQVVSLFTKVSYHWALAALTVAICVGIITRKSLILQAKMVWNSCKWYQWVLMGALVILVMIVTSLYPSQYDNYLYQAQSIRFLEEYGCVKGTANIAARLGFNNSIFALMALASFKNLFNQYSLHTVNACLCAICGAWAVYGITTRSESKQYAVKAIQTGIIAYVFYNMSLISSVGTDIPALLFTLMILALWAELTENGEKEAAPYGLLCLLIVFTLTIKFSMWILFILVLPIAYQMLMEKSWKSIGILIGSGVLILVPFLIRNYYISGWLLFPFEKLDLFQADWKVPIETVAHNAVRVYGWARIPGVSTEATMQLSFREWWPVWWKNQTIVFRILYKLDFALILWECFYVIAGIYNKNTEITKWILLKLTIISGFLYWAFSAPDVRFGWCYIVVLPLLCIATSEVIGNAFASWKNRIVTVLICVVLLGVFHGNHCMDYVKQSLVGRANQKEFYLYQGDYAKMPVEAKEVNGVIFYFPVSDSCTGYYGFPGVQYEGDIERIGFLGDSFQDGLFHITAKE